MLLVDEVNTRFDHVAYERDEIKRFVVQHGGKLTHPMSLAFFTDHGSVVSQRSTSDGNLLLASFDKHQASLRTIRRATGFYGAVERFQLSMSMLHSLAAAEAQRPGRKLVVWISPGWPYLSGPGVDLTSKDQAGLFASIVAISNELRRARMTLYSIDPLGVADAGGLRVSYYENFLKPVIKPGRTEPANLSLQVLAIQSGGMALNSSNDISAQIDRAIADAEAYYTLQLNRHPPSSRMSFTRSW